MVGVKIPYHTISCIGIYKYIAGCKLIICNTRIISWTSPQTKDRLIRFQDPTGVVGPKRLKLDSDFCTVETKRKI